MDTERAKVQPGGDSAAMAEQLPIDAPTCEAAISRGRHAGRSALSMQELADLAEELRGQIQLLLPARHAVVRLWPEGPEWHRHQARLKSIEQTLGDGLGDTLFSAHVQVQLMARDCEWLLANRMRRTW